MASRIRVFDRTGILIREIDAPAWREWVLNDIGSARFTIKAAGMEQYVQYGNYLTIENDKLDTWVGVINTPRPWGSKVITVNAKSAMWLFQQRAGSNAQAVSGSWGEVFSFLLGLVNAPESTLLKIGNFSSGISYSSVVDLTNVYTYLQRALAQAQTRLDFRPVITNGSLVIYIDVQPTLYSPSSLRLEEGLNIKKSSTVLLEQGEIYNDVTIMGIGLDQVKYTANAIDLASIEKYGRRQKVFAEGQSQTDVNRLAVVRLAQYAYPRNTLALTTLNKGDTFLNTRVGYSGTVELKTQGYLNGGLGFRSDAYIDAVQFDDKIKEGVLVCKEV